MSRLLTGACQEHVLATFNLPVGTHAFLLRTWPWVPSHFDVRPLCAHNIRSKLNTGQTQLTPKLESCFLPLKDFAPQNSAKGDNLNAEQHTQLTSLWKGVTQNEAHHKTWPQLYAQNRSTERLRDVCADYFAAFEKGPKRYWNRRCYTSNETFGLTAHWPSTK